MVAVQTSLGVDVGTSGARVVATNAEGALLAKAEHLFGGGPVQGPIHEQDPEHWWALVCRLIREVCSNLDAVNILAISVTSTSGTLVLTDLEGNVVRPAIMYDDSRSAEQAKLLNDRFESGTHRWNSSHNLCKALWVREHEPHIWRRARRMLSPADWLMGRLSGHYGLSDYSNSLKLGYDFELSAWEPAVRSVGIDKEMLPSVVSPGFSVGNISSQAAFLTHLPVSCSVVAGSTDGLASLIASGARNAGDSSTTLGTTMVWKALSSSKPVAAKGVYAHRHPLGLWAPGAASNTGPGAIENVDATDIQALDQQAAKHLPVPISCYLVARRGERFPFVNESASTFFSPLPVQKSQCHAAQLQALALTEKWGYELIADVGVDLKGPVYSAGSASRSRVFSEMRACVLNKPVVLCRSANAAFGAAILAASSACFGGDLCQAISCMTKVESIVEPDADLVSRYEDLYFTFRQDCRLKGYVS